MRKRIAKFAGVVAAGVAMSVLLSTSASAQAWTPPRTPDGQPDIQGYWDAKGTSGSQNIEDHPGDGGFFFQKAKSLIVDPSDGKIPYQSWALERRKDLFDHYVDPYATCVLSGVPRQIYSPRGHLIIQSPGRVLITSEWSHESRIIPIDGRPHLSNRVRLYMGDSRGRWEGNTLVVDTTNFNGKTWLDVVGDFHSDRLHVTERFMPVDANTIGYETTLEDPNVYTRPWTMAFLLGRNTDPKREIWEENCHEGNTDLQHLIGAGYKLYVGLEAGR